MNDTGTQTEQELIFRRLNDRFPIGPTDASDTLWWVSVGCILGLAFLFVIWKYARDSQRCRWYWAVPLALLRMSVYTLLAGAFMLPAIQTWEETEKHSRVVILLDITPSVSDVSDEFNQIGSTDPKTRIDRVLDFLTDEQVGFLKSIVAENPVFVYRFGTKLDEEPAELPQGSTLWNKDEWQSWLNYDFKQFVLKGLSAEGRELLTASKLWEPESPGDAEWAIRWASLGDEKAIPAGLSPENAATLKRVKARLIDRVDVSRAIVKGTNVPDSVLAAVNRESNNMLQGVILFSDGRSNLGSSSAYQELSQRLQRESIPLYTIAVGTPRENISINISGLQAPDLAPPDEAFKIVVEADGVGLADQEVTVRLGLYLPGHDPKEKPEPDHELSEPMLFQAGTTPPHGVREFFVDPEKLPEALTQPSKKLGKTREMKPGEWSFVARIARDEREAFSDKDHVSTPRKVQVIDRPLRVLMFASAATREYQTLRTLLVREVQQNRAELSICLQNDAGRAGTAVQDVPPERLLAKFPTRLDTTKQAAETPEQKYLNLDEYDLIIAFDPDWSQLNEQQIKNIQSWIDNLGGGFIYVAGPINTFQLARAEEEGRLAPILNMLPVIPDDIILVRTRPIPREPRRLALQPSLDADLLKLEDDADEDPLAGWEYFFDYGDEVDERARLSPERGFYGYYPVKETKPGATVLADFLDLMDQGGTVEKRPWIVTGQPARGRTAFLASGEFWRLREADSDYYDRFWIKLSRYIAANRDAVASRGRILMNKEFVSGSPIRVQARLLAPTGQPYPENAIEPKFIVTQYDGGGEAIAKNGPYTLKPSKSGNSFDGYYVGQINATVKNYPPGAYRYRIEVDVPDSPGDKLNSEFGIVQSDPEMDNTRPDFDALTEMASTLESISGRVKDAAVLSQLQGSETDPNRVKLAYRLNQTEQLKLLPQTMIAVPQTFRNRGEVRDLWDKPLKVNLRGRDVTVVEADTNLGLSGMPKPLQISFLLLLIVVLLSIEWMTRKLLRLA